MTTPTPGSNTKIVTTQYYPSSGTTESITTESISLLDGRKAENLTAIVEKFKRTQRYLCYAIIPLTIVGVALLITTIVIWNTRSDHQQRALSPAIMAPLSFSLGLALGLGGIYLSRSEKSITISREEITV